MKNRKTATSMMPKPRWNRCSVDKCEWRPNTGKNMVDKNMKSEERGTRYFVRKSFCRTNLSFCLSSSLLTPCLRVSVSPCLRVSLSPCLPVSLSPCLPVSLTFGRLRAENQIVAERIPDIQVCIPPLISWIHRHCLWKFGPFRI